jgi:uncharacterized protein
MNDYPGGDGAGPQDDPADRDGSSSGDGPPNDRAHNTQGDDSGGDRPFRSVPPAGAPRRSRRTRGAGIVLAVVVVAVFIVLALAGSVIDLATDAIWFGTVGFDSVFWTRVGSQAVLFLGVGAFVLIVALVNLWLAGRFSPPPEPDGNRSISGFFARLSEAPRRAAARDRYGSFGRELFGRDLFGRDGPTIVMGDTELPELPDLTPIASVALVIVSTFAAIAAGAAAAGSWATVQLWLHRVPFSSQPGVTVADPIFGLDVSFYLFDLPFYRLLQGLILGLLAVTLLVVAGRYAIGALRGRLSLTRPARIHLGILGALILVAIAVGYQLDRFGLVYSDRGVAIGVSYTDQNAVMPALVILTVVALVVAVLVVVGAALGRLLPIGIGIAAWLIATVLLLGVYPEFVQRFNVQPNELALESPYITNNIKMTRLAFDLDRWTETPYQGEGTLTAEQLLTEKPTFDNARLWDYRPLGATIDQIQTVRQYFDFFDVSADRYVINDELQQVWISARELAPERNPQAQSWVNQRITYTHGFGAVMTPVSGVTNEGLPVLYIRDMPPVSSSGAPTITQPRIYFGVRPSDYVVVNAKQPEFDYPVGGTENADQSATTSWTGATGIKIDNPLTRLLYALRLRDLNLLISDQLTADSKLLINRSVSQRLPLIAPFLEYDYDPYLVITSTGRLVFIQDAYTVSDLFPNAQPFDASQGRQNSGLAGTQLDYIRNSVKIVMDAYDGTVTFYAADPGEPILRAWEGVFPNLLKPLDEMPADLRAHLRTPEDMFDVQTRTYATYHVTDPQTYYRRDDLWTVPVNPTDAQQLPVEAYFVTMRLPDEAKPEFLLLQPMVPTSRPNMIAWIGVRNDAPNYGRVQVYRFPRDTSIFGPIQIEARIDQDPLISSQITLWDQAGSTVIKGNLIVIPVQESLLYLEPIYLQSTSSQLPEFQKIVVASPTKVVWASTLGEALRLLIAGTPGPGPSASPGPSPTPGPGASPTPIPSGAPLPADVRALVDYANQHFELAQAALRNGDFATYGEEMKLVQAALQQLSVLTGVTGSPAP